MNKIKIKAKYLLYSCIFSIFIFISSIFLIIYIAISEVNVVYNPESDNKYETIVISEDFRKKLFKESNFLFYPSSKNNNVLISHFDSIYNVVKNFNSRELLIHYENSKYNNDLVDFLNILDISFDQEYNFYYKDNKIKKIEFRPILHNNNDGYTYNENNKKVNLGTYGYVNLNKKNSDLYDLNFNYIYQVIAIDYEDIKLVDERKEIFLNKRIKLDFSLYNISTYDLLTKYNTYLNNRIRSDNLLSYFQFFYKLSIDGKWVNDIYNNNLVWYCDSNMNDLSKLEPFLRKDRSFFIKKFQLEMQILSTMKKNENNQNFIFIEFSFNGKRENIKVEILNKQGES